MELYFAPLEGITGYVYRNAFHSFYTGVDKYFIPFISPNQNRALSPKEIREVLPEHNRGMYAVPQILTNHAEYFLRAAQELEKIYGYKEVNLNLGCPSRTVVSKGKGAGFLAKPAELDAFLREIFENVKIKVSVKTRTGMESPEEFCTLMEIFNRYPLYELIVHPRVQKDYYNNTPDWKVFAEALRESKNPVCYNGDIFTLEDYRRLKAEFQTVDRIMLGRGLLRNPELAEEIKAEEIKPAGAERIGPEEMGAEQRKAEKAKPEESSSMTIDQKRLKAFHDRLYHDYRQVMSGDKNVLFKMKEFWSYAENLFPEEKKIFKAIKKATRLCDYEQKTAGLFILTETICGDIVK